MSPQVSTPRCHRCLQSVPTHARRCPQCGVYLKTGIRKVTIWIALIGTFLLLGLVGLGIYLAPPQNIGDDDGTPQQAPPPKPEKKPPLN